MKGAPGRRIWQATTRWRPALPVLVFLAVAAVGIWVSWLVVQHHRDGLMRQTEAVAVQFAVRIEEHFAGRLQMAEYLRDIWAQDPRKGEADFRRLARTMLTKVSDIRAINWVDQEGVIRWVMPERENLPALGLRAREHPPAAAPFARAASTGRPTATPPTELVQGGRGVAVYVPLGEASERGGFLNIVFRLDRIFPLLWEQKSPDGFGVAITDGEETVYATGVRSFRAVVHATATARVVDRPWTVSVRYYGATAPGVLSRVPEYLPPALAVLLAALIALLLHGHLRNVDALRERERALGISEGQLRSFLENSPNMVTMKTPDGRYILVNGRIREWFGIAPEAVIGRTTESVFDTETQRALAAADRYVIETGSTAREEHRKYFADGKEHILVSTKFPVRDADGGIVAIGSFVIDVTEQRRTEAQLRQAQKMEAVGNMTGGLAHDFNNLLTIILGNLQMLERQVEGPQAAMAESAIRAARRATDVTQRLLAFSRRHPLSPETVDLRDIVGGLDDMMRSAVGSTIALRVEAPDDLWPCHVDPSQFEVALINLAINARDAMPNGGTLSISMANERRAPATAEGMPPAPQEYVAVTLRDTGVGMLPEVLEHAIEPFFTTKVRGKGTGLGLSMVYGFAKQSDGDLHLDSTPGMGTRVTLYLPRAKARDNAA